MREYRVWNKQDEIVQGVSADYIMNSQGRTPNDDFFLIYENGSLTNIETVREVAPVYKIDPTLPIEQFAQLYLDIRQANDEKAIQDALLVKTQAEEIKDLKTGLANTEYILMMGGLI